MPPFAHKFANSLDENCVPALSDAITSGNQKRLKTSPSVEIVADDVVDGIQ